MPEPEIVSLCPMDSEKRVPSGTPALAVAAAIGPKARP